MHSLFYPYWLSLPAIGFSAKGAAAAPEAEYWSIRGGTTAVWLDPQHAAFSPAPMAAGASPSRAPDASWIVPIDAHSPLKLVVRDGRIEQFAGAIRHIGRTTVIAEGGNVALTDFVIEIADPADRSTFLLQNPVAGGTCVEPPPPSESAMLGVGCSDPYDATLNGQQANLGPRSEVNPYTGFFPFPFGAPNKTCSGSGEPCATNNDCPGQETCVTPPFNPLIGRRLQVHECDLDPTLNPDTVYLVEGQYVVQDEERRACSDTGLPCSRTNQTLL